MVWRGLIWKICEDNGEDIYLSTLDGDDRLVDKSMKITTKKINARV